MLIKAGLDFEKLKAIFLKKPPFNLDRIHFFLVPDVSSRKQNRSRRLRIFCPKKHSVMVCLMSRSISLCFQEGS